MNDETNIVDRLTRIETRLAKFMEAFGLNPYTGKIDHTREKQFNLPKPKEKQDERR
jgi:hypothetical protein